MAPSDDSAGEPDPGIYIGMAATPVHGSLPIKPYGGTPLWRRIVALLGLGAFSVLGGIVIFLTIAALIATAAIVLQLVIS